MAQVKEQNPAQAQNNPNRNSESGGEKRTRTRRPYYNRRPRRTQQPKEAAVPIHIYPLGGLGEVGKNMTVYECNGDMIIVDCGLVFPDSEMYGVDMVIPDFTFVVQNKEKIKGLLITHGHEDHIGSIPYLLQKFDLPIYGTRLTCGLIRNKLEEFGLAGKTKFVEITPKQKIKLGRRLNNHVIQQIGAMPSMSTTPSPIPWPLPLTALPERSSRPATSRSITPRWPAA